jgi:hypothetical protein
MGKLPRNGKLKKHKSKRHVHKDTDDEGNSGGDHLEDPNIKGKLKKIKSKRINVHTDDD